MLWFLSLKCFPLFDLVSLIAVLILCLVSWLDGCGYLFLGRWVVIVGCGCLLVDIVDLYFVLRLFGFACCGFVLVVALFFRLLVGDCICILL